MLWVCYADVLESGAVNYYCEANDVVVILGLIFLFFVFVALLKKIFEF